MKIRFLLILNLALFFFGHAVFSQDPTVEKIAEGFMFTEGPVMLDSDILLFSDIPANTVYQWTADAGKSVYLTPSGNSNGLYLDRNGKLLLAQHGSRQVARLESDMSLTPLATHYNEKRLNSPNDLVQHSDGSVFFTDPPYGLNDQGGTSELGYNGIYRISPSGEVQLLDNSLYRPNGIGLSPDESRLYVSDTESRIVYVWDLTETFTLSNKRQLARMQGVGGADGMTVGRNGRLFVTGPEGVWVIEPDGTIVTTIAVPGQTTNCCWSGPNQTALYVTSGNAVYKIELNDLATGIRQGRQMPQSPFLFGNYPNPFNDSTKIRFQLFQTEHVRLTVYNIHGESIRQLFNQVLSPGTYQIPWHVSEYASSQYIYALTTESGTETGRCLYIK